MSTTEIRTATGSVYHLSDGHISRMSEVPVVGIDGEKDLRPINRLPIVRMEEVVVGRGLRVHVELDGEAELLRTSEVVSVREAAF